MIKQKYWSFTSYYNHKNKNIFWRSYDIFIYRTPIGMVFGWIIFLFSIIISAIILILALPLLILFKCEFGEFFDLYADHVYGGNGCRIPIITDLLDGAKASYWG